MANSKSDGKRQTPAPEIAGDVAQVVRLSEAAIVQIVDVSGQITALPMLINIADGSRLKAYKVVLITQYETVAVHGGDSRRVVIQRVLIVNHSRERSPHGNRPGPGIDLEEGKG